MEWMKGCTKHALLRVAQKSKNPIRIQAGPVFILFAISYNTMQGVFFASSCYFVSARASKKGDNRRIQCTRLEGGTSAFLFFPPFPVMVIALKKASHRANFTLVWTGFTGRNN